MSESPRILVFDSGAGGLTIGKEILLRLPPTRIIFASDKTYFPYGDKPESELLSRLCEQLEKLLSIHQPDILIVACNTASTIALEALRTRFSIPIVGVVPAIKPAARLSKSKVIGLLATPATSNRRYTHKLIEDFAQDCSVIIHGSRHLVSLAERRILGEAINQTLLQQELATLFGMPKGEQIDTVVLACTHFPILRDDLDEACKLQARTIHWVDSGQAIAKRTADLLGITYQDTPVFAHDRLATPPIFTDCNDELDLTQFSKAALDYLAKPPA
ncbi:Glutamate racemase [Thalassocella blandensis]|nr:Glutamate racemase [Thalassocella blandensis]